MTRTHALSPLVDHVATTLGHDELGVSSYMPANPKALIDRLIDGAGDTARATSDALAAAGEIDALADEIALFAGDRASDPSYVRRPLVPFLSPRSRGSIRRRKAALIARLRQAQAAEAAARQAAALLCDDLLAARTCREIAAAGAVKLDGRHADAQAPSALEAKLRGALDRWAKLAYLAEAYQAADGALAELADDLNSALHDAVRLIERLAEEQYPREPNRLTRDGTQMRDRLKSLSRRTRALAAWMRGIPEALDAVDAPQAQLRLAFAGLGLETGLATDRSLAPDARMRRLSPDASATPSAFGRDARRALDDSVLGLD